MGLFIVKYDFHDVTFRDNRQGLYLKDTDIHYISMIITVAENL